MVTAKATATNNQKKKEKKNKQNEENKSGKPNIKTYIQNNTIYYLDCYKFPKQNKRNNMRDILFLLHKCNIFFFFFFFRSFLSFRSNSLRR